MLVPYAMSFSSQPSPADQLQMPPTGSKLSPLGQTYSQPSSDPFSSRAHDMNFLHDVGCGKLPMSKHSIEPAGRKFTLVTALEMIQISVQLLFYNEISRISRIALSAKVCAPLSFFPWGQRKKGGSGDNKGSFHTD